MVAMGVCTPKIGSVSVFKKWTVSKSLTSISDVFRQKLSAIQFKNDKKITLVSFNAQIKNVLKHYWNSLAYRF